MNSASSQVSHASQESSIAQDSQPARQQGSIRKLLSTYGFIAGDDGVDYFLHWSGMDHRSLDYRQLRVSQRVSFRPAQGDRGLRAVAVVVLEDDEIK